MTHEGNVLYIFLDEGGNLDFSKTGTRYFVLTALSKQRPFEAYKYLNDLKYNQIESGAEIEYFHAAEDRQAVRNSVFEIIDNNLDHTRIDSLIIEKNKISLSLRVEEKFYPEMFTRLLVKVMEAHDLELFEQVIVFTDSLPVQKKRHAVEKSIKRILASRLPAKTKYNIFHHSSKSNYDLQIVDYCNWAIYRKMEREDGRSHDIIKRVIRNEIRI